MATPDFIFYLYKTKRIVKRDSNGYKSQDQNITFIDIPFKQYEEDVFNNNDFRCKTCPYFQIESHKTVWGKCGSKYRNGTSRKKTSDKNRCHPDYRKLIKFHCSGCGKDGKHQSFLIKDFGRSKYFRVFLCQKCKERLRFYSIKSYYRYLRNRFEGLIFNQKNIERIQLSEMNMSGELITRKINNNIR